jgi:ribonuclease P protein component
MVNQLRFRSRQRLHLQRDFARVSARRCSEGDDLLVVYVDSNGLDQSRLGIRAGKRLGGAVVRNRIKRRIREAFRLGQGDLPTGLDIVCVARAGPAARAGTQDFAKSLETLIPRAHQKLIRKTRSASP